MNYAKCHDAIQRMRQAIGALEQLEQMDLLIIQSSITRHGRNTTPNASFLLCYPLLIIES